MSPGFFCAQLFRIQSIGFQKPGRLFAKKTSASLSSWSNLARSSLEESRNRGAHANLNVPIEGLYFGIVRPPDIQDVGAIKDQISLDCCSGDHMTHSEGPDSIKWSFSVRLERNGLAFRNFFDGD